MKNPQMGAVRRFAEFLVEHVLFEGERPSGLAAAVVRARVCEQTRVEMMYTGDAVAHGYCVSSAGDTHVIVVLSERCVPYERFGPLTVHGVEFHSGEFTGRGHGKSTHNRGSYDGPDLVDLLEFLGTYCPLDIAAQEIHLALPLADPDDEFEATAHAQAEQEPAARRA